MISISDGDAMMGDVIRTVERIAHTTSEQCVFSV